MTTLLLDTNAISDLLAPMKDARDWAIERRTRGDQLVICLPIYYEVLRGLLWRQADKKLSSFNNRILPLLDWVPLTYSDWTQAAHFWASARNQGKQLGDPDLLLAALAVRLTATIVSRDQDFDALSVKRIDWRKS